MSQPSERASLALRRRALWIGGGVLGALAAGIVLTAYVALRPAAPPPAVASVPPLPSSLSAEEIASRARRATVQIRALDSRRRPIAEGTGFFVAKNGLIATNVHVIRGADALEVETLGGDIYDLVYLVTADSRRDIAILRIPVDNARSLPLASDEDAVVGATVYVMGNPLGQVGTFSNGLVSAQRSVDGVTLVQITAPVSPGSSGGPVMNAQGEVIGVTTLMLRGGQNLNYAVPVRYVRPLTQSTDEPRRYARSLVPPRAGGLASIASEPADDRRTGEPSVRTSSDVIEKQFRVVDSMMASNGGVRVSDIVRGRLEESGEGRHDVTLRANHAYVIVGYCDERCGDLDLKVTDEDGILMASDYERDDTPYVRVQTDVAGHYLLTVSMAECRARSCGYGVRLYRFE